MLDDVAEPMSRLSKRERDVASLFAEGLTYREIGERLFIAPATVRTHLAVVYRKLDVRSKVALAALVAKPEETSGKGSEGPAVIGVLPFESSSTDSRWERLADGLSADLIVDLARYPDLALIARQTMFTYKGHSQDARSIGQSLKADFLLEGSLQATDQTVRIRVQLIDAKTGIALWTALYDRTTDDFLAVQDTVAEQVVNVLASCSGKVAMARRNTVRRKPPSSLHAYDLYLLGQEQHNLYTRASHLEAVRLFSRAVEIDPDLSRAWTVLGLAHSVGALNGYVQDKAAALTAWRSCLERAVALDPGDTHARLALADLRALDGDLAAAAREHDVAYAMAPNDADTLALLAASRAFVAGDPAEGLRLAQRSVDLNSAIPSYHAMVGRIAFVLGLHQKCLASLQLAPQASPNILFFQAMAYAALGETRQSQRIKERLRTEFLEFSLENFIQTFPVTNPPTIAALRNGAKLAGLWPAGCRKPVNMHEGGPLPLSPAHRLSPVWFESAWGSQAS